MGADTREYTFRNATCGDVVINVSRPGQLIGNPGRELVIPAGGSPVTVSKDDYEFAMKIDIVKRLVGMGVLVIGSKVTETKRAASEPEKHPDLAAANIVGGTISGPGGTNAEVTKYEKDVASVKV